MRRLTRVTLSVAGAALVLGGSYLALVRWTTTILPPGTIISGVDVGGMSRDDAMTALTSSPATAAQPIRLVDGTEVLDVDPAEAGIVIDVPASVAGITAGGWLPTDIAAWFSAPRVIDAVVRIDDALLDRTVRTLADRVRQLPTEPALAWTGKAVALTLGEPGRILDTTATTGALRKAVNQPRTPIRLPVRVLQPNVPDDEARRLQAAAQQFIDQPPVFRSPDVDGTLGRRVLQRAIVFKARYGTLVPVIDGGALARRLIARYPRLVEPGIDAGFRVRRGTPEVTPASPGYTVDAGDLAQRVAAAVRSSTPVTSVALARATVEPDLTDVEALGLGVRERLSSFTQRFPYAPYRVQNIGRAARYIDGTVLLPGETFSMNDVIRERTIANGYTTGIVVGPGGIFAEDLGGGVSAATTTVWTAAFFAGLERVETRAHSIYISRYQPGLEATVAWGVFDMRFRNNTPNAVLITAKTTNTSMTVRMWGTRVFDSIRAEFGDRTNIRPHTTIRSTSPSCTAQTGMNGFDIVVDRVFVRAGVEVAREKIRTAYKASPDVTCRRSGFPPNQRSTGARGY